MAVSLQSITELSVYPWENITEPGSLLNKSDSALLMAVPLFCQGYITDILYFLQDQMVLFGGQSGFRLDQALPLPHRSIYHDHFHCLFILWMGNVFSCFLSYTSVSVDWIVIYLDSGAWSLLLARPLLFYFIFCLYFYPYSIPTPISLPSSQQPF